MTKAAFLGLALWPPRSPTSTLYIVICAIWSFPFIIADCHLRVIFSGYLLRVLQPDPCSPLTSFFCASCWRRATTASICLPQRRHGHPFLIDSSLLVKLSPFSSYVHESMHMSSLVAPIFWRHAEHTHTSRLVAPIFSLPHACIMHWLGTM